jgi:hypothetical protein
MLIQARYFTRPLRDGVTSCLYLSAPCLAPMGRGLTRGRIGGLHNERRSVMKNSSARIIGSFTATETGYTGKLDTLAIMGA